VDAGTVIHVAQPALSQQIAELPAGARLKLRMGDGSVISLTSGSRMTIHTFGIDAGGQKRDAKLILTNGLLRAVVSPVSQPSIFEVDFAATLLHGSAGL